MTDERVITTRRTIQQIVHCAEEALGVIEREEDIRCAIDDLNQARELIDTAQDPRPEGHGEGTDRTKGVTAQSRIAHASAGDGGATLDFPAGFGAGLSPSAPSSTSG